MAEGNYSDGFSKTRAVFGDLTNRLGKRGSSEREKRGIKSFDYNDKDVTKCIRLSPHPFTGINSSKGNVLSSNSNITNENREASVLGFGCSKSSIDVETGCDDGYCLKGKNNIICDLRIHGENEDIMVMDLGGETAFSQNVNEFDDGDMVDTCGEISSFDDGSSPNMYKIASQVGNVIALDSSEIFKGKDYLSSIDPGRRNASQSAKIEADDELCDSFPIHVSRSVSESVGKCPHNSNDSDVDESKASFEGTQSDIGDYQNDGDYHDADNLVSSQCGSIDCTNLPESQESRVYGVEKSMELKKGDDCALNGGTDSIKACSCSFCTKAAYMWLDLNYQDIKARVSATRKVQKEATILAERSIRSKVNEKHGAESLPTVSKLESDLMYQWRSLFQHMAGISEEEGNQLETRLLPLVDLMQKCKTDLALMKAPLSEKH